ncbi:hypothetical protein [Nocardia abscessus]|uniref:hypothetical protein n=1 Tax=Nocardia abscessus TaxID=120957 RepID=UPI002456DB37|nr:hypothetical protein [Nocardia abscessus]
MPNRPGQVVIDAIVATVTTFARGGYDVVVDGIVGPWFLPPLRAAADRDGLTLSYVVLRPDLDTTLSRARQRAEHELKDVEAITGLYAAFERLADPRGPRDRHRAARRRPDGRRSPARPRFGRIPIALNPGDESLRSCEEASGLIYAPCGG